MIFTSVSFLFYFLPIVFLMYYLFSFSRKLQNIFLLMASLLFYAWGDLNNTALLIALILLNYALAIWIDHEKSKKSEKAKIILAFCIIINIGFLFFYKYIGFVFSNISLISSIEMPTFSFAIPLGISFYVLQMISYVVDSYQDKCKVEKNIIHLGLFVSFFPQLITGPIVRYPAIAPQFKNRKVTYDVVALGAMRFIVGLSKKVLIANMLAYPTNLIYAWNAQEALPILLAWLGAILFMLQLYFDFSGYSDMAIGLGLMFGFVIEENFNYPYVSTSVSEFWRRWHISLSLWLRDYIYIPLGGSRVKNQDTMVRNLLVVWTITGLWHGANWNYLLWGWYFFLFIFVEKLINFEKSEKHLYLRHLYLLLVVCVGFVLFRCESLPDIANYLGSMFGFFGLHLEDTRVLFILKEYGIFLIIGIIFSIPIARRVNKITIEKAKSKITLIIDLAYPIVLLSLFALCMIFIIKGSHNPFLYAQF